MWNEFCICSLDQFLSSLDRNEGVSEHYIRKSVTVWNVEQCRWVVAEVYTATRADNSLEPPKNYLEEIIVAAKAVGLNTEWISKLKSSKKNQYNNCTTLIGCFMLVVQEQ